MFEVVLDEDEVLNWLLGRLHSLVDSFLHKILSSFSSLFLFIIDLCHFLISVFNFELVRVIASLNLLEDFVHSNSLVVLLALNNGVDDKLRLVFLSFLGTVNNNLKSFVSLGTSIIDFPHLSGDDLLVEDVSIR